MTTAQTGATVRVHYTGSLSDGTVFDSSEGRDPLAFTIGQGQIIPGFEEAVVGMAEGESKTVTVPPEKAYGPHMPERVAVLEPGDFPPGIRPMVGHRYRIPRPDGLAIEVQVTEVTESSVTLDGNHPLAGKPLTFAITLVSIA